MPKTDVHHTSTPTGGLWGPLKPACSLPPPRARTLCRQAGIYYAKTIARGYCFLFLRRLCKSAARLPVLGLCSHFSREGACGGLASRLRRARCAGAHLPFSSTEIPRIGVEEGAVSHMRGQGASSYSEGRRCEKRVFCLYQGQNTHRLV